MAATRRLEAKTLKVGDFFNEFEKDEIKKKVDIVNLFNHFGVSLKQKGKSFIGNCPWHEDKTPSLSVDNEKGLYNCFGCGESGDVFSLVEKMKSVEFKESLEYLKEFASIHSLKEHSATADSEKSLQIAKPKNIPDSAPAKAAHLSEPIQAGGKDAIEQKENKFSLNDVSEFYRNKLAESKAAQEYLKKRGIVNEVIVGFNIGFSDGKITETVGAKGLKELKDYGIITEKDYELFTGCVVVPLSDIDGRTLSFYARNINPKAKIQHLYLSGEHKAVFNEKAYRVYDKIILTESVIDALSLISAGVLNVSCIFGANGMTKLHVAKLHEHGVREIILALDNDEAGRSGAEKFKDVLINEGFGVKVIFPQLKDWNEMLVSGKLNKDNLLSSIDKSELHQSEEQIQQQNSRQFRKTDSGIVLTHDDIVYTVRSDSSSRLNVKCEMGGEVFYDRVDLVSARSRLSFAGNVSHVFDIETKRIEKDLIALLEYYENDKIEDAENIAVKNEYELSEEEKTLGMKFLRSTRLYEEILEDMCTLGYVGEAENKLLVYLAGVSRLLPKPLSVFIQSPPSTGKSYLLETLLKMLPEESVEWITSMSDQAFNYMDKDDFLDKIFMLGEALHNETIEGYIRQMQSENKIARKVTMKDPKNGSLKSVTVSNKARLVFMQTSAAMKANSENLSRCLVLTVDNSISQTELVLEKQRFKSGYDGYLEEKHVIPEILRKHKSAQRLLQKIPVFNPYEKYIRFPAIRPIMRRAQGQFLNVMSASCLLRQMQKEPVVMKDHFAGREESVYECDLVDYDTARRLFINGQLLQQDEEISTSAINLYEAIRRMIKKKADKKSLTSTEVTFIQKEVREITTLGNESIKRYLRILVEYEYLQLVGGKRHGTRFSYRLREDASIEAVDIATLIPTIEEIKELILKDGRHE